MKIAFAGKSRSGKDTAAGVIKRINPNTRVVAFSDRLYKCMWAIQDVLGFEKKKDPGLLQLLGEGARGHYNPNIWVDIVEKEIGPGPIVVTDVRYKNEYEMLRKRGFIFVRVKRSNRPIDRDPNHISEIDLDDVEPDYEILNDGTLEQFEAEITNLYERLRNDTPA